MTVARETRAIAAGFAIVCAVSGAFALRHLDRPGLYYDEAIQAVPALVFLENAEPPPIPGLSSARFMGRWFPVMTQPYMGALKSQALLGPFAIFGASAPTLRVTTWLWTLLAILLTMLWVRRVLDLPSALLAGALLGLDPSVLFVGRHDWGSFALGFTCRAAALLLLTAGWRRFGRGGRWRLGLGGFFLGLGLYNKLDFGIFLIAGGAALLIAAPRELWAGLRTRLPDALTTAAGLALGAAPMLASLPGALGVGRALGARAGEGAMQWGEKAVALSTTLDGSYFHRLMLSGGRFDELSGVEGSAAGPFLALLAAAAIFLALRLFLVSRGDARDAPRRFILAATLLTFCAVFLTPRAVRIHHFLNATPLPQILVAMALVDLWRLGSARRPLRLLAVGLAALALLGSLRVDVRTLATIVETGGRGRWSDALDRFASELGPETVLVSLDWGFAQPLRLLRPDLRIVETTWALRGQRPQLEHQGGSAHVYLVPLERYAVFGRGEEFLRALDALPADRVSIEHVADRSGDPAFRAVRIAGPHRVDYRRGLVVGLR